jgi:Spy/CpxP family protein refolding chaperone
MRTVHVVTLVGLGALTAIGARAQDPGGGPGPERWWQGRRGLEGGGQVLRWLVSDPKAAEVVGLKPDQVKMIEAALLDARKKLIELRAKMELAAVEQAELIRQENADEAAVMKAVERTGELHTEIAKLEVRQLLAVRRMLTPEQQQKLHDAVRERMRRWRENRPERGAERRPHGPPPGEAPPPPAGERL